MYKTVCELIYETYTPQSWYDLVYFNAAFIGEDADTYKQQWNDIVCGYFIKIQNEINELKEKMYELDYEYVSLTDDRTFFQKLINSRNTPNWDRKKEIDIELQTIYNRLRFLGEDRSHEIPLVIEKTHLLLEENGFLITNHCTDYGNHYEIWTKEQ